MSKKAPPRLLYSSSSALRMERTLSTTKRPTMIVQGPWIVLSPLLHVHVSSERCQCLDIATSIQRDWPKFVDFLCKRAICLPVGFHGQGSELFVPAMVRFQWIEYFVSVSLSQNLSARPTPSLVTTKMNSTIFKLVVHHHHRTRKIICMKFNSSNALAFSLYFRVQWVKLTKKLKLHRRIR